VQLAAGILRHRENAQDAVQSAFFLAFRRMDSFRGDASFKTWITRIVVNCCLLQLREARNRVARVQLGGFEWSAGAGPARIARSHSGEIGLVRGGRVSFFPRRRQATKAPARSIYFVHDFRIVITGRGFLSWAHGFRD
jgi:hypothetical protein